MIRDNHPTDDAFTRAIGGSILDGVTTISAMRQRATIGVIALFVAGALVVGWLGLMITYAIAANVVTWRATERHEKLVRSAVAFGSRNTAEACVAEALARADRCPDSTCAAEAQDFLAWSLTKARDSAEFCRSISAGTRERQEWVRNRCLRRTGDAWWRCVQAMQGALGCSPS